MHPLDKSLRNKLESAIKSARDIAESAARAAVEQLGVGEASPYSHLSDSEKELRRKLRIHSRQLGDVRDSATEKQETLRLVEEIAYEHWHRMLFARFLAENNLLMYDGVAISLQECDELAQDEGAKNGWEFASRCAAKMLPQIFRTDSPVFQLVFPLEYQQKLEKLVAVLPLEVFTASDSLGWVYQFWQADNKERINKSEVKIGARELPAVTQLFTEPYMVSFLLDNSLGAWWAAKKLTKDDWQNAKSEEELRQKASITGVPLEYLRFVKSDGGLWQPAAGTFDSWPKHLSELKTLDPCCGSGHFLVAVFMMLVALRIELEKLSPKEAVDKVLKENIHALELDQRCVELAAFALALTAWRYPNAGGYRVLPELHLACSGLSVSVAKEEWRKLALDKQNMRIALESMYEVFKDAPILGSLLDPSKTNAAKIVEWKELEQTLQQALAQEQTEEQHEIGVAAQGLSKAATLLAGSYNWVVTNVPYLARGKQNQVLANFCEQNYPEAKNDLATVFLERCLELSEQGGTASIVLPQNWLFLGSYKKFREKLLKKDVWHLIARLGEHGFDSSAAAGAFVAMISISKGGLTQAGGIFGESTNTNILRGVDVSAPKTAQEKAEALITEEIKSVSQAKQLENPDARVALEEGSELPNLDNFAECFAGVLNGDSPRFQKKFWEILEREDKWTFQQTTIEENKLFGGLELILFYDKKNGHLREEVWIRRDKLHDSDQRGNKAWGKYGISISQMRILPVSIYTGETFDSNIAVIYPKEQSLVLPILTYCQYNEYNEAVRRIDQKLNVTNATLVKVPFDLDHWTKVAAEKYPNGLPKPYSDDPTQWIFHGHPCGSVVWDEKKKWTAHATLRTDDTVLQIAVARLLGYRWPAELDAGMELADEQRAWVKKCDELLAFADEDGIVCIPPVRGETAASDRLLNLLAASFGDKWNNSTLSQLLASADHAGKTLESWLREKFFIQHCKLFQHRPFIWHIWDGLRDGFSALVNYHKLDYKNLETLIYTYLGDWITRQKQDANAEVDGAQEKLAAAENLKKKLELILEGEAPLDIFVRWKPLSAQPIGWNPDINDGVRLNIRPFMTAGVLKPAKLNIKWDKDRGKDVESAPWFKKFGGDRINDYHLKLEEKRTAKSSE